MTGDRESAYRLLSSLPPRERGPSAGSTDAREGASLTPLASEIGYGAIRHRSRLDWVIEKASGRKGEMIAPKALTILRIGAYQLLFMPSIPRYAAVSEGVELALVHIPKARGFVNWVLRRIGPAYRDRPRREEIPDRIRWMAVYYSFPPWIVRRWTGRFGPDEAERLLDAMNTFPPLDLRVNTLRAGVEDVEEELRRRGGSPLRGTYSPACLHSEGLRSVTDLGAFAEGLFYIQDESSQLAPLALSPLRGEGVLDACAGLGGKATHLAEISRDGARITAVDRERGRLALLRRNAARLGITSVAAVQGDLLSPPFPDGTSFERILVDAPCSSLGIIRRHPELKWSKRASDPKRFQSLQIGILCRVSDLLAEGGVLAYSTCTTEPEENEAVVHRFLEGRRHFKILRPPRGAIDRIEELLTPEGFLFTLPHRHGMNGSFTALLQRSR